MIKRLGMVVGLSLCMMVAAGAPAWATINDLKACSDTYGVGALAQQREADR